MFEKDLYALIRGLRNHKDHEKEYIQNSIAECRKEIRSQDMDQKATALLKLVYLEMLGNDMSWASFHVLEVMSSTKYVQKRVGYLGAVQSFRPDTEVLMLAENLLKKDLTSPQLTNLSLVLVTLPHIANPSMASSLLDDLLSRLSHSNPSVKKKAIVTLYRLALVYPDILGPAWSKIKERLLDPNEDSSVTAAIVNVICELSWRRPQDFLPLAPRLFELLVDGGNNWMAIKIIKLFAVLTPHEPRLIKKLLPPLTTVIRTTGAMSLSYECINGMIQGGLLNNNQGTVEGDEIARLCVTKLGEMLSMKDDPNLTFVALLAMAEIVRTHPDLVTRHADVILECIDNPDISIRTRALDLVVGMVDSSNLVPTVERLLRQLRQTREKHSDDGDMHALGKQSTHTDEYEDDDSISHHGPLLSENNINDEYRATVIHKILSLCSKDNYANLTDFEWYINILVELVRHCPMSSHNQHLANSAVLIGKELQNIAVRVKAVRLEVTAAAQSLLLIETRTELFPPISSAANGVLGYAAWIVGEYAEHVPDPGGTLTALTHPMSLSLPVNVLCLYVTAIPKIFIRLASTKLGRWTEMRKSNILLSIARIIHFLEALTTHHDLEVQERAVEYIEIVRLASDAMSSYQISPDNTWDEGPPLLTQVIPLLFTGQELNPVAPSALRKVPISDDVDLDTPINESISELLQLADDESQTFGHQDEIYQLYHKKPKVTEPSTTRNQGSTTEKIETKPNMSKAELDRLKVERKDRQLHDPFYIDSLASRSSTPSSDRVQSSNSNKIQDMNSIPIVQLQTDDSLPSKLPSPSSLLPGKGGSSSSKPQKRIEILSDESIEGADLINLKHPIRSKPSRIKNPLDLRGSNLSFPSLDNNDSISIKSNVLTNTTMNDAADVDEEMKKALQQVEAARMEMQRSKERIEDGEEVRVVKKKKKKVDTGTGGEGDGNDGKQRKKMKKQELQGDEINTGVSKEEYGDAGNNTVVQKDVEEKKKKKKKRVVVLDDVMN